MLKDGSFETACTCRPPDPEETHFQCHVLIPPPQAEQIEYASGIDAEMSHII